MIQNLKHIIDPKKKNDHTCLFYRPKANGIKQTTLDLNYNLLSFGLIEVEMLKTQ